MQFPMSVKWFELLRKRAGEFRMTPPDRIFRQVQNELPGQAIPGLKEQAEAFVVQPSAGLFDGIQAGLANQVAPELQEQADAFRLNPSEQLFEKIQQQLPGQASQSSSWAPLPGSCPHSLAIQAWEPPTRARKRPKLH